MALDEGQSAVPIITLSEPALDTTRPDTPTDPEPHLRLVPTAAEEIPSRSPNPPTGETTGEVPVISFANTDGLSTPSGKAAYQDLFLRSIDSILLVEISTGKVLEANDASMKVFRLSLEELQNTNIYDYCDESFLGEFRKMIRIASRRYHPKTFEIPMNVGSPKIAITGEMAASPLKLGDQTEVLQLIFRDITEKKESERKIAEYIRQVEEANKKLEELATTDGMTGLTNFRQFSKLLETEHARAARYKSAYSIVFCDIDHFKKYNDQNGHPAGDALLKHFAKVLRACVRTTDIPARYGGEEFVVLCPETTVEQARAVAERIRSTVASIKYPGGEKQPLGFVSCSIGVSSFPACGASSSAVLKAADEALYQCKHNGRNCISLAREHQDLTKKQ